MLEWPLLRTHILPDNVHIERTCLLAVRMTCGPIPVEYVFGGVDEFSVLVAGLPQCIREIADKRIINLIELIGYALI